VDVAGETVGEIAGGLLVLVGVAPGDTDADADTLAAKICGLRIFPDSDGAMNLSVADIDGSILVVSQFTLLADIRKGRRPSFIGAAGPHEARAIVDRIVDQVRGQGVAAASGEFGAAMMVSLVNSGPVTIVIDVAGGRIV